MKRLGPRASSGLLAAALLTLAACGGDAPGGGEAHRLDEVFLAPAVEASGPMLLASRHEVTRAAFAGETAAELAELPAVRVNRAEAARWAATRGMRLPTRAEWLHLRSAGGEPSREVGQANTLELGLGRALPVGVFENGRTGLGGYDFDGNVWEWLADGADRDQAWQAGGSFASYRVGRGEAALRAAHPADRASDLGFRPVAEAIPWLASELLDEWLAAGPTERARMAASIARWGPELRSQLARRWREAHPEHPDFAEFLEKAGAAG